MAKQLIIPIIIALAAAMATSCKSDPVPGTQGEDKSVQVKSFNLADDYQVLDSLENVFFSIDLKEGKIFNADSLPYGTKTDRLIPEITVVSTASLVEIQIPRPNMKDTVYDYNEHSTDSVDFSNGPVHLRVVSQGALVERTYEIKVNVHQVKPDTIAWSSVESAPLPTAFGQIDGQKVVELDGKYYCLTSSAGRYSLAVTSDPYNPAWQAKELALPFDANVSSLAVAGGRFFMLDAQGNLRSSADMEAWTETGCAWRGIYGAYGAELVGCSEANGMWAIEMYPSGAKMQMPDGFPVEGTSAPQTFDSDMAYAPQLMMVGGRDAQGQCVNGSWAYDGQTWAMTSHRGFPEGYDGMCLVAYDLFTVPNTTWRPRSYPALLAFGGISDSGEINRTVYTSSDWGMTWRKGSELIQLPAELEVCAGSSAIVYATTMHASRSALGWTPLAVRPLHPHCAPVPWTPAASRVDKPITEWECPAIYVYGGRDAQGRQSTKAWRGQLIRYTFLPKY